MTECSNWRLALAAGCALVLAGCGGAANDAGLVPVGGTVLLDGLPLAGASVTFIGLDGTPGEGGTAITDAAGKYEIANYRTGKGTMPGDYKVIVNKRIMGDGTPIPSGTLSIAELETREQLPARFSDYGQTTLTAKVQADGPPIDFQLSSR